MFPRDILKLRPQKTHCRPYFGRNMVVFWDPKRGARPAAPLSGSATLTLNIDFAVLLIGVSGEGMVLSGRPDESLSWLLKAAIDLNSIAAGGR